MRSTSVTCCTVVNIKSTQQTSNRHQNAANTPSSHPDRNSYREHIPQAGKKRKRACQATGPHPSQLDFTCSAFPVNRGAAIPPSSTPPSPKKNKTKRTQVGALDLRHRVVLQLVFIRPRSVQPEALACSTAVQQYVRQYTHRARSDSGAQLQPLAPQPGQLGHDTPAASATTNTSHTQQ